MRSHFTLIKWAITNGGSVCILLLIWLVINYFDWQFCLVCREKEYKIKEFSIEAFRQKPSYEVLCSCRKADLYEIAECYAIPVIKTARKKEV